MSDLLNHYAATCGAWIAAAKTCQELSRIVQSVGNTLANQPGTSPFAEPGAPAAPAYAAAKVVPQDQWPTAAELVAAAAAYKQAEKQMQEAFLAIPADQRVSQKPPQDVRADFTRRR